VTEFDSSNVAFFVVDSTNILGYSSTIQDSGALQLSEDRTPLGASTERQTLLKTIAPVTIGQEGWFDDGAGLIDAALKSKRGVNQQILYAVEGGAIGTDIIGALATQTKYDPKPHKDGLTVVDAGWECQSYDRGLIVADLVSRTAAGNTQATPVHDVAADSAAGAQLYLACTALALGGYTNLIVQVMTSTNGSSWVVLDTFTALTLIGKERRVIAGAVRQYLAIAWAYTGSGSSPSWTGVVGVARN
jgi:hypothetical protein